MLVGELWESFGCQEKSFYEFVIASESAANNSSASAFPACFHARRFFQLQSRCTLYSIDRLTLPDNLNAAINFFVVLRSIVITLKR